MDPPLGMMHRRSKQEISDLAKTNLRTCEPQPDGDVEQPISLCANMTGHPQNRKYVTYHYATREGPSHGSG